MNQSVMNRQKSEKFLLVSPPSETKQESKVLPMGKMKALNGRRGGFRAGRGSGKRRGRKGGNDKGIHLPPEIDATVCYTKTYRYIAQDQSGTQKTVTVGNLLLSLGSVATTTSELTSICSSFKINWIKMYPAAGGFTLLEWVDAATTGLNMKDERKGAPLPSGITVEKPITYYPPKDSQVSWWQDGQGVLSTLFALSATVGTVVDMHVTCTITNCGTNAQSTGFTSLTVGAVYYPALEGRATNDFAPYGRPNAT